MTQNLVQHGANPLERDNRGVSLLHWAAGVGNLDGLKALLPYFDDDDRELFLSSFPSGESSTLTIRDRATGDDIRGNFGLRTAILPDEELYYRGSWSASNREGPVRDLYMDGGLSFYVDFTTGDISGVSNVASIEYSDDGGDTYDITTYKLF